jgi:biopolymer transport protein ExbD
MRTNTTAGIQAQPNVTPMIDVMLVLLIIFMTIGPYLDAGFRLVPPSGQHLTKHPDESADAVIGLDVAGQLFYDKKPITEPELRLRLRARFAAAPEDRLVYVRADQGLDYARVQSAMDLASAEGARVVGLVASADQPVPAPR